MTPPSFTFHRDATNRLWYSIIPCGGEAHYVTFHDNGHIGLSHHNYANEKTARDMGDSPSPCLKVAEALEKAGKEAPTPGQFSLTLQEVLLQRIAAKKVRSTWALTNHDVVTNPFSDPPNHREQATALLARAQLRKYKKYEEIRIYLTDQTALLANVLCLQSSWVDRVYRKGSCFYGKDQFIIDRDGDKLSVLMDRPGTGELQVSSVRLR